MENCNKPVYAVSPRTLRVGKSHIASFMTINTDLLIQKNQMRSARRTNITPNFATTNAKSRKQNFFYKHLVFLYEVSSKKSTDYMLHAGWTDLTG
mgnify:CR=1 FL=1